MNLERKRASELLSSVKSRQANFCKKYLSTSCSRCAFCTNHSAQQSYFPLMINKALYTKYSSSQNYYYTRGLNEFLTNARTENVIKFKDNLHFEEDEEYLKRLYNYSEYEGKITMLTEYYKFHRDIARTFMLPSTTIINHYHDKKRRLEYIRVTKMLREQNQDKTSPSIAEAPKVEKQKAMPIMNRVLDDLEITETEIRGSNKRVSTEETGKGNQKQRNRENHLFADLKKKKATVQDSKVNKVTKKKTGKAINKDEDKDAEAKNLSCSQQTIQELNWKLGEIISTSYSQNFTDTLSHFENNEKQENQNMSNLDNFLEYIQSNNDASKLNKIPAIFSSNQPVENNSSIHNINYSSNSNINQLSLRTDSRSYAQSSQLNSQKQVFQGQNLADAILRRVSLDQPKNHFKKLISTDTHDEEQPFTILASSRIPIHRAKPKTKPPAAIKIQNFEEALRFRQQTSPRQLTSQNSTSRDGSHSKFLGSLSQRTHDGKSVRSNQLQKIREVMTTRRESYTNSNLLKTNSKATKKPKTSLHVTTEKPVEIHSSRTNYPGSQKEIRTSLDMHPISRHMSQPAGIHQALVSNLNFASDNRFMNKGEVDRGKSFSKKSQINRVRANGDIVNKVRGKYPSSLAHFELQDKDIKVVPMSACLKPGVQTEITAREGYKSFNRLHANFEPEIFNLKEKSLTRKALTHRETNTTGHKYNKSEVKLGKFEFASALGKKASLPQSLTARDTEQVFYNEGRYNVKEEFSPSRSIHTYNYNNIVNVIIQPNVRCNKENDFGKEDFQRMGLKQNREITSDFFNSNEFGRKDKELIRTRRSDVFNIPQNFECAKSPPSSARKEELKSSKIKNKYRSSLNAAIVTYSKGMNPVSSKGSVEVDLIGKRVTVHDNNNYKTLLKFKRK